jgi:uncharacterized membrane protein
MERASRGFREGLRRELPAWRAEGLVTDETARALAARYDLASVEAGGPSFLAVYVLGALLVGAGVVSLVAWHWEAMSAPAKLATLAVAMIAAHGAGSALWRGGRSQRLGHALTVLGTLVFGASIGLVAQIFHVSGAWWGAFGAFTLGALAAALLYESLPHLLLAAVAGLWLFGPGLASDHALAGVGLGYAGGAAVAALAWRERSRALLAVGAIGVAQRSRARSTRSARTRPCSPWSPRSARRSPPRRSSSAIRRGCRSPPRRASSGGSRSTARLTCCPSTTSRATSGSSRA